MKRAENEGKCVPCQYGQNLSCRDRDPVDHGPPSHLVITQPTEDVKPSSRRPAPRAHEKGNVVVHLAMDLEEGATVMKKVHRMQPQRSWGKGTGVTGRRRRLWERWPMGDAGGQMAASGRLGVVRQSESVLSRLQGKYRRKRRMAKLRAYYNTTRQL